MSPEEFDNKYNEYLKSAVAYADKLLSSDAFQFEDVNKLDELGKLAHDFKVKIRREDIIHREVLRQFFTNDI